MELPMFPLQSVLMPGQVLPLHVFEPRYREMLAHCLAGDREFGVVLIDRGPEVGGGEVRTAVGTVARILQAEELQPDHWAVISIGTRRVSVTGWGQDDPWPRADVQELIDSDAETAAADPAVGTAWSDLQFRFRDVEVMARALGAEVPDAGAEYSLEPGAGSLHLAALAPIGALDKQAVLATTSVAQRISMLDRLLAELHDTLRAVRDAGESQP